MKQLYTLLYLIFSVQLSHAQDSRLYDYDWKLVKLVVDHQNIPLPNPNAELNAVMLKFIPGNQFDIPYLMTNVCNTGSGNPQFSTTANTFTMESFVSTLIECNLPQNESFEYTYFSNLFFRHIPNGIFYYTVSFISDGSGRVMLLLSTSSSSYAHYSGSSLSSNNFNQDELSIAPNPASDCISIHLKDATIKDLTVEIYDSLGKMCLSETALHNKTINIQQLSQGMYFLKASIGDKTTTKKFMKL